MRDPEDIRNDPRIIAAGGAEAFVMQILDRIGPCGVLNAAVHAMVNDDTSEFSEAATNATDILLAHYGGAESPEFIRGMIVGIMSTRYGSASIETATCMLLRLVEAGIDYHNGRSLEFFDPAQN